MGKSISKSIRDGFYGIFLRRAPRHVLKEEMARRQIKAAESVYGSFLDADKFNDEVVPNPLSETKRIGGIIAHAIRSVSRPTDLFLLSGERRSARQAYSRISGIPEDKILTAGWHEDMDFQWNFEMSPPAEIPQVDLIASKAMIEHLIDPFKHLSDCYGLLKPGGHMVFTTVIPGFKYHRYPVDCLRFFPDWFEEVARRLGAEIVLRSIGTSSVIAYTFRKPASPAVS